MEVANKIVLVQKGALGDFLQAWPSMLAISRQMRKQELLWAGKEAYSLWTEPLGFKDSPLYRKRVEQIYAADTWPPSLEDCRIIWFGLRKAPTESHLPGLWFIPMLEEEGYSPPQDICLQHLRQEGFSAEWDWKGVWSDLFPSRELQPDPFRVLLFPGAGHPSKCWPLERFLDIAQWLRRLGYRPCFVLGPAELERGMRIEDFPRVIPDDFWQLQRWIQSSGLVFGNDSGPLHLAACCQAPGLALFGPSPARQWGPQGLVTLSGEAPCRPCTRMGIIHCSDPVCLRTIGVKEVRAVLRRILPGSGEPG